MVHERDEKYEGQDEGEYHFSDDQATYDVDTETVKVAGATAAVKQSPLEQLKKYRRVLIAVAVFFVLMFIVYKMLTPATTNPPLDFSQQAATTTPKPKITANKAPTAIPAQPAVETPAPVAQPAQPAFAAPVAQPVNMPPNQMAQTNQMQQVPTTSTPPPVPQQMQQSDAGNRDLADRLASLEQQNAKLTNILQIEYAQKMSDYEAQNTAMQAKVQELNKRVANMEGMLNQITQLLQEGGGARPAPPGMPAAKAAEPKQMYTVQAIIPGRAWLKSDAGDTVTVAEGDILKEYGRVTKIDPYDGVVVIDTGNKVISLSYGSGSD